MNNFIYFYELEIGEIAIIERNKKLAKLYLKKNLKPEELLFERRETKLIKECHRQILEYLSGERFKFDLPLDSGGSDFQKKVWASLLKIPYGETRSYKDIAQDIGNPKAYRAVGNANGKNPILIIIPCHRVIAADSSLGGYSSGIDLKKKLLKLEAKNKITTGA